MKRRILKAIGFIGLLSLSTLIVISLNIQMPKYGGLFELSNLGMCAEGPYPSSSQSYVDIQVYYDTRETVIHQNYADDYGECSWITIVAIKHEKSKDGTIVSSLYDGTDLKVLLVWKKTPGDIIRGIDDVTDSIYFTNPGTDGRNFLPENWKGFYYVLGKGGITSAKSSLALISEHDADNNDWSKLIDIGKGHNPVVILVKDWVWSKTPIDIMVEVYKQLPGGRNVKLEKIAVKTNVDNVDFAREKIGDEGIEKIPAPGKNYSEDPGKFVISDTIDSNIHKGRLYDDIMDILVDVESGTNPFGFWPLKKGRGPDWLQVAAADIYNSATKGTNVTNCVWKIEAIDIEGGAGQVSRELPFLVQLNPYRKVARFNEPEGSYASFFCFADRDATIYHEALHCYQLLPGADVYDEEDPSKLFNDELYVGSSTGAQNRYLRFSWDSRKMGFLDLNLEYSNEVDAWLYGLDGDSNRYPNNKMMYFITEIDFTSEEINKIFVHKIFVDGNAIKPTDIPSDLPDDSLDRGPRGARDFYTVDHIYLYKPAGFLSWFFPSKVIEIKQGDPRGEQWIVRREENTITFSGVNGTYTHSPHTFMIQGYYGSVISPDIEDLDQYIEQGYTKFYVTYSLKYKNAPCEYDASYFEITHKKE